MIYVSFITSQLISTIDNCTYRKYHSIVSSFSVEICSHTPPSQYVGRGNQEQQPWKQDGNKRRADWTQRKGTFWRRGMWPCQPNQVPYQFHWQGPKILNLATSKCSITSPRAKTGAKIALKKRQHHASMQLMYLGLLFSGQIGMTVPIH